VLTLGGALTLAIGGQEVRATPQTLVLMPANVPHPVHAPAPEPARMLLIMLREPTAA
jgi:quercetin dioxygenase-like cupin family protein